MSFPIDLNSSRWRGVVERGAAQRAPGVERGACRLGVATRRRVLPPLLLGIACLACACLAIPGPVSAEEKPSTPPAKAPESYRLQPGDEVTVSVLPRKEFDFTGPVSPDGLLYLKDVGSVRAAGLTIPELTAQIRKTLEKELRKPRVTVTLLRLIQPLVPQRPKVTVAGAVGKPGPLDLEEGLRVRKALDLAGGHLEGADLSQVVVIHKDLTRTVVDLSTPERVSSPAHNRLLKDGDSIEVPQPVMKRITIVGAVGKPGPIPLEEGLRIHKALELAGGVTPEADLSRVVLVHKDLTRSIVDLAGEGKVSDPAHNRLLADGDSIEVLRSFQSGVVTVAGAVTSPGSYELKPGWAMDDLILAAGRLSLVADVEHVELRRAGVPVRTLNLQQQQNLGAGGRVPLEPGDEVFIPEQKDRVVLIGPVPNPGLRALKEGQTINEFFTKGHPETLAALDPSKVDLQKVRVIRDGKEAARVNLRDVLGQPRHKQNLALKSGDVIFLPPREEKQKTDYLRGLPFVGTLLRLFVPF